MNLDSSSKPSPEPAVLATGRRFHSQVQAAYVAGLLALNLIKSSSAPPSVPADVGASRLAAREASLVIGTAREPSFGRGIAGATHAQTDL